MSMEGDKGWPNPNPSSPLREGEQGGGKEWLASNGKQERGVSYEEAVKSEWVTEWQVRRASWMARRFAEFREKLAK